MPDGLLAGGPDEMVSGDGRIRPHWRPLMGLMGSLGRPALVERAERLARAQEEEGPASLLPGAKAQGWRLDPLPLPIAAGEFAALSAGIAQRARLLEALLADLYGPQEMLAEGLVPPALLYGSGAFLRAARRANGPPRRPFLHLYAADLLRGADGRWAVLQDRTTLATGIGQVRENRRLLTASLPEAFRVAPPRHIGTFFDIWQQALARLAPRGRPDPAVALLSAGTADPHWFEHVVLSRELGCALVEPGDLTVRGGAAWLKTLGGLQPIDVLLSRLPAGSLDPLDHPQADAGFGVPGLLDAMRHGALAIANGPGAALAEAPGLLPYLPALAPRLLGEELLLQALPTWHLTRGQELPALPEGHALWLRRPAGDGAHGGELQGTLPWDGSGLAATALPALPTAPSLAERGFAPRGLVLRLFAVSDGQGWEVLPGGLARIVEEGGPVAGRLPGGGSCKDVWVAEDEAAPRLAPAPQAAPPLPIRRSAGAIPSRVADNVFWLGRYVERLDRAARLTRATIARMRRGSPSAPELAELATLAAALREAALLPDEAQPSGGTLAPLAEGLRREAVPAVQALHARIGQLTDSVRDRLTSDMHATFTQSLRVAEAALMGADDDLPEIGRALIPSLRFSTAVAGVAAENMVLSGARLFLELGRRVERAQAVASEVAAALDVPPPRIEAGLRLVLELCDSVITYRSRYLSVLQPAPALDLVLADPSNPRGLAFQLVGIATALDEVSGEEDADLAEEARTLLREVEAIPPRLLAAPDQAREAASLPSLLRGIASGIGALSDRVTRRHFALLPAARAVGVDFAEIGAA
jgi:uncharacterized circularly permuted ATP-grasp superfamily protein/uncharacterized alpha-E superfamily protein